MYHRGGCQAVGSELHRSPPAAMEDGKSWPRIIDREGWGFKAIFLHIGTHTEPEGEWHAVRLVWKRLVFYPNSVTKPTNQSIYCNFSACVWPSRSQPIWQEQLRALYLFCQRTHSHLTQIQDSAKAHLMGTCPACTVCRCHLFHAQEETETSSQLATRVLHQKLVGIFCCFYSKRTKNKNKKQSCFLSPLYNNPQISLGYTPLC